MRRRARNRVEGEPAAKKRVYNPIVSENYTDWSSAEGVREFLQNWYDVATKGFRNTRCHHSTWNQKEYVSISAG